MADTKKLRFSKSPILKTFLRKFHGLVLGLVGLIDTKGIDVAQPNVSSKTGKKCIFGVFRLFMGCRTASQPYRLSHVNALRINQSY